MSSSLAFTTSEWPTTVSTRESASSASSKKTDRMLGSNEIVDVAAFASINSATASQPGLSAVAMDPVCSTNGAANPGFGESCHSMSN
jgi:hypothetical protein